LNITFEFFFFIYLSRAHFGDFISFNYFLVCLSTYHVGESVSCNKFHKRW